MNKVTEFLGDVCSNQIFQGPVFQSLFQFCYKKEMIFLCVPVCVLVCVHVCVHVCVCVCRKQNSLSANVLGKLKTQLGKRMEAKIRQVHLCHRTAAAEDVSSDDFKPQRMLSTQYSVWLLSWV